MSLPARTRSAGLDATRAFALVAMVFGHTFDALLAERYRQTPLFQAYLPFRGMTAPLFLFVSGWAVMTRASRVDWDRARLLGVHLRRAGWLFAWALALRWPSWDIGALLSGDAKVWSHWLGPDALACIAAWLALSGFVLLLPGGSLSRLCVWMMLAVATPYLSSWAYRHPFPLPWGGWLEGGAESPFPLVPWGGYFCVGAAAAYALTLVPTKSQQALTMLGVGFALLATTAWLGLDGLPLWSARLLAYRAGFVVSVAGVMLALPERWIVWSTPFGRSSLAIYVLHLPMLYGWGTMGGMRERWGANFTPWQAGMLALLLVWTGTRVAVRFTVATGGLRYASAQAVSESQRPEPRNEGM